MNNHDHNMAKVNYKLYTMAMWIAFGVLVDFLFLFLKIEESVARETNTTNTDGRVQPGRKWVLVEVKVPCIVGEVSSFGNYPKSIVICVFPALDESISSFSLNHSLQSNIP